MPSYKGSSQPRLGWTGWISLQSKGLSRVFSYTTVQKHVFLPLNFHPQKTPNPAKLMYWGWTQFIMHL